MIKTPDEIAKDKRFNGNEKLLLSIYVFYTVKGNKHCCMLTNATLAERIGVSEREIMRYKNHLKELGLIETNGGIKVWYKGDNSDTHNNDNKGDNSDTHNINGGDNSVSVGVTLLVERGDNSVSVGGDNSDTHNKNLNEFNRELNKGNLFPQGSCYNPEEVN